MLIYRIEHESKGNGMWYNSKGEYDPFINTLTDGKSKHLPMNHDDKYRYKNLVWYSGCQSLNLLLQWFSEKDIDELLNNEYKLYEIIATQYMLEDNEILFTKEGIISKREIELESICKPLLT